MSVSLGLIKAAWNKLLKEHQITTCAAAVTKEDFPSLVAKLWDCSFKPEHLKSGFWKTGLCPLSRNAITSQQLTKSLPFSQPSSAANAETTGTASSESATFDLTGTCTVGSSTTPMTLHLHGYFTKLLEKTRERPVKRGDKSKARPCFYGEALNLDEVTERFTEAEAQKASLKKAKPKGINEKYYNP